MPQTLHLLRHPALGPEHGETCIGRQNIALPPQWADAMAERLVVLKGLGVHRVVHSGLERTEAVARLLEHPATLCDERLLERSFGNWEGRLWDEIYEQEPIHSVKAFVQDPLGFVPPGGGESLRTLRARVLAWTEELPSEGATLAITHGTVIAALRGTLEDLPYEEWPDLLPEPGAGVTITLPPSTATPF